MPTDDEPTVRNNEVRQAAVHVFVVILGEVEWKKALVARGAIMHYRNGTILFDEEWDRHLARFLEWQAGSLSQELLFGFKEFYDAKFVSTPSHESS